MAWNREEIRVNAPMMTSWGKNLDPESPLPLYPRPQLVRSHWVNLNGPWDYAIKPLSVDNLGGEGGLADATTPEEVPPFAVENPLAPPTSWDGQITVPFSPEVLLSGVSRTVMPDQSLWYQRTFVLDTEELWPGARVLLHFGAVDQSCRVAVNGVEVGGNVGGYLPFTLDITQALQANTEQTLTVVVRDVTDASYMSHGKQALKRGGIWYTPQSGIWQTVWIEVVPAEHIWKLVFTPDLDSVEITVAVDSDSDSDSDADADADAPSALALVQIGHPALFEHGSPTDWAGENPLLTVEMAPGVPTRVPIPEPALWSPDYPALYPVQVTFGDDKVASYFALRTVGVGRREDGKPALLLNGKPHFAGGVLDQGYWPDGGYTAPADEALVFDIATAKSLGYNMLRKHVKIEPLRWYHHCDRLGMLVWQDAVNGGRPPKKSLQVSRVMLPYWVPDRPGALLGRSDPQGLAMFAAEVADMVDLLYSTPSVVLWVPFNEGWGQFDAALMAQMVKQLDPSRPVDHASGWFDQGGGDLHSVHLYFRPPTMVGRIPDRRVLALTEYGGLGLEIPGHVWGMKTFGYLRYRNPQQLATAFTALHSRELPKVWSRGLGATVYTQFSDVEDEVNGLVTYDRCVVKVPEDLVRHLNVDLRGEL